MEGHTRPLLCPSQPPVCVGPIQVRSVCVCVYLRGYTELYLHTQC